MTEFLHSGMVPGESLVVLCDSRYDKVIQWWWIGGQ